MHHLFKKKEREFRIRFNVSKIHAVLLNNNGEISFHIIILCKMCFVFSTRLSMDSILQDVPKFTTLSLKSNQNLVTFGLVKFFPFEFKIFTL